jgi:hypothetical protein
MADHRLWGFWSYARELADASGQLQGILEESLRGALGRAPEVRIFRDVNQEDGTHWRQELVRGIRRSVLFFWLQSPSHLNSPACRFELEMFRAQVARIAGYFGVPAHGGRLFEHWMVPIRWQDVHDNMWPLLRSDPATAQSAQLWSDTQVQGHFDIARHGHSEASDREHGIAMGTAVRDKLYQSLPLLGAAPPPSCWRNCWPSCLRKMSYSSRPGSSACLPARAPRRTARRAGYGAEPAATSRKARPASGRKR